MKFDDLNEALRAVREQAERSLADRAQQKQSSRDADERALESGEKTPEELRVENGAFAFPRDRVRIDFSRVRSKY